jgi:hypothetical protein
MSKLGQPARTLALCLIAGMLLAGSTTAAERPGLVSLELPIGPRAVGMGSAYVSIADDATAMYWNPAGLARLGVADKHWEILFQHNEWISDFRQEYVGGASRYGKHAYGASFSGFYISDLDGRDQYGQPTVTFGAYDIAVTGSYAYAPTTGSSIGGSVKYLVANIDDLTHFAFALDVGGQLEVYPGLWLGGAVTNIGSGIQFVAERDDLPTALQVGGSYTIPQRIGNGSLMFSADVRKSRGDDAHGHFGAEYDYAGVVQIQGGYRSGYDNDAVSFGLGAFVQRFKLQYALVPFDSDLGSTHRFAIGVQF